MEPGYDEGERLSPEHGEAAPGARSHGTRLSRDNSDGALHRRRTSPAENVDAEALAARALVSELEAGDGRAAGLALVVAAREGHSTLLHELLAARVPVDARDAQDGTTALHWCCGRGAEREVTLLLARGAPVGVCDARGWAPLHIAAARGHAHVLRRLLRAGADASSIELECNKTALHWACFYGREDCVTELLSFGAEINAVNHLGDTPAHEAARGGHAGCLRRLLAAGADANGIPPLDAELSLASKNLTAALRFSCGPLFGFTGGGDAGAPSPSTKGESAPSQTLAQAACPTPLHLAARSPNPIECCAALMAAQASVDAGDGGGNTALHVASSLGDAELCERLLEGGATADARGKGAATALRLAAEAGHVTACMVLLAHGADPFVVPVSAATPDAAMLLEHVREEEAGPAAAVRLMLLAKAHADGWLDDRALADASARVPPAVAAGAVLRSIRASVRRGGMSPEDASARAESAIEALDAFAQAAAREAFPSMFTAASRAMGGVVGGAGGAASALQAAASAGDADALLSLLGSGCDPDARDATGATALHAACRGGHARACRVLLAGGASPLARRRLPKRGELMQGRHALDAPLFGRISALVATCGAQQRETPLDVAVGEARPVLQEAASKVNHKAAQRKGGETSSASRQTGAGRRGESPRQPLQEADAEPPMPEPQPAPALATQPRTARVRTAW